MNKKIVFLISKYDNNPFDTMTRYFIKENILEISTLKLNDSDDKFLSIYYNKEKKNILINKKYKFLKLISYVLYTLLSLSKIRNIVKLKSTKYMIVDNLNNFLGSFIFKIIFRYSYQIIFFDGDALPETSDRMYIQKGGLLSKIKNKIILFILYKIKFIALKYSKYTIHNSKKVIKWNQKKIIEKFNYIYFKPAYDYAKCLDFSKRKFNYNFLYIGKLHKTMGFDTVINISIKLKSLNKKFLIHVLGGENDQIIQYKKKISNHNLNKNFRFYGYMSYGNSYLAIIKKSCVAFAPYNSNGKSIALNGKISDYLNYCLPVVTTNYILTSSEIKKNNLGLIYQNEDEIIDFLIKIESKFRYIQLVKNIKSYVFLNDYIKTYNNLFSKIDKNLISF